MEDLLSGEKSSNSDDSSTGLTARYQSKQNDDQVILTDEAIDTSPVHELPSHTHYEASTNSTDEGLRCCSGKLVLWASMFAAVGGLLFGYDTGIISGALPQLMVDFDLDCEQAELVVSTLLMGAVIAALIAGSVVDIFGRRRAVIGNSVVFIVGTIIQASALNLPMLIVGRVIIGFGVSLSAIAECIYIAEISPMDRRGFLVSLNEFSITVGFLLAYLIGYFFINISHGWRYMFGLGIVPAVVQCIGMVFMPPSPRYLVLKGRTQQAKHVLQSLRPSENTDSEIRSIESSIILEQEIGYRALFSMKDNMLPRLLICIGLVTLQQVTGQPNVLYYAPVLFKILGVGSLSAATLATVGLGVVKVTATGVALYNLDRYGRRSGLIAGAAIMMFSILVLGIVTRMYESSFAVVDPCRVPDINFTIIQNTSQVTRVFAKRFIQEDEISGNIRITGPEWETFDSPAEDSQRRSKRSGTIESINTSTNISDKHSSGVLTGGPGDTLGTLPVAMNDTTSPDESSVSPAGVWAMVIALMAYVAGYAVGFGPGSWLILSEVFPATIRGRALSLAVVFNWLMNLIVSVSFLNVMSVVGASTTFFCYGAMCAFSVIFIWILVPETKGKSLEEISVYLQHSWTFKQRLRTVFCCPQAPEDTAYRPIEVDASSPLNSPD